MKRHAIFAAVAAALALPAAAQPTNVPEQKCEPKPVYPGMKALRSEVEVKAFEGQIRSYKECIMGYISDRKSAMKANETAAVAATEEHNKVMDKIRTDQEAQRTEAEKQRASEAKDNVTKPGAPQKY